MLTITPEAIAKVEQFISAAGGDPMDWFVCISWKWGAADNRRTKGGDVLWERVSDEGWMVDLGGWRPNRVPREEGVPLYGDVRALIEDASAPEPFPGGEIYVDGDAFKVRAHAI